MTMTPMMKRYTELKAILPKTTLLFFRLGDFYEAFFDDAATAAKTLGLSLTKRCGTPMCGFPYHAKSSITDQLCKAGFSIALAEIKPD